MLLRNRRRLGATSPERAQEEDDEDDASESSSSPHSEINDESVGLISFDSEDEGSSSLSESSEKFATRPKIVNRKALNLAPKKSTHIAHEADWTDFIQSFETWSKLNEEYSQRLDLYLRNNFEKNCNALVTFLEFDLRILDPAEMFKELFKQVFKAQYHKAPSLADMSDSLSLLADTCGDDPNCPKFVVTIYHWVRLLNAPNIFCYIEEMIQPQTSPFVLILKSDLVRRVACHHNKTKLEEAGNNDWETIILFPRNHGTSVKHFTDLAWYGPLFEDIILQDRSKVSSKSSQEEAESPTNFLKESIAQSQCTFPKIASGYIFSQGLYEIRGLPKTAHLRTLSAPIKALEDLKNVAYRDC